MSRKSAKGPSLDDLKARLREAGLRSTAARVAVLRYLWEAGRPVTHADVSEHLESEVFDRATLYRNLIDLAEAGLVSRSDLGDHVWRFELRQPETQGGEHPHFVCVDCGAVSCVPGETPLLPAAQKAARALGDVDAVVLKGHCATCR